MNNPGQNESEYTAYVVVCDRDDRIVQTQIVPAPDEHHVRFDPPITSDLIRGKGNVFCEVVHRSLV